jgi:excisionase family DNA binding protein
MQTKQNHTDKVISIAAFTQPEPILTPEQVAERLQVDPKTVYSWTRRRNMRPLPAFRPGGKFLRFKWSEVERWLEEGREAA